MRQTFDQDTAWEVAIKRTQAKKKPGRKHNHQPRGRALENRHRARVIRAQQLRDARAAFSARVAAYWRGEVEVHP